MADNLRELIEEGIVKIAEKPRMNSIDLEEISSLDAYTVPLIDHDYPAGTPRMWNSVYTELGLNIRNIMVIANPKNIKKIFDAFKKDKKYLGGGAGSGFKDTSVPYLDRLSENAQRIGSINLIVKESSKLIGYNTDGIGYVNGLEEEFGSETIRNKKIVVLGAGGVTPSIVYHLLDKKPLDLVIINRTIPKAERIVQDMKKFFTDSKISIRFGGEDRIREEISKADIVINTSNKGTEGQLSKYSAFATTTEENIPNANGLFNKGTEAYKNILSLNPHSIVSDINIREGLTTTLRVAKAYGTKRIQDGLPMVFHQAVPAFILSHKNIIISEGELEKIMSKAIFGN